MFNNKNILITGAAQGLGRELSLELSKLGANLYLIDIDKDKLDILSHEVETKGYLCDISDIDCVVETANKIRAKCHIDILINSAGVWTDDNLEQTTPSLRKRVFEVNALGTINITDSFIEDFKGNNSGTIVNVISTSGAIETASANNQNWKSYGASKWALVGYSNALRKDIENTKIKLVEFYPGGFESNLYENAGRDNAHNQPWMMKTRDIVDALLFTISRPVDVCIEKIVITKK